jgi:hypothetical protein
VGNDGYQVVLSELLEAAADYASHSRNVQQMLTEWEKAAGLDKSVFGNMAVSSTMSSQYAKFHDEVSKAVTQLYQSLGNGATTLLRTAAGYQAAEQLTTQYLQFVSENTKHPGQADSHKER